MKDEHIYGKKWPDMVVTRSFIKGHSFPITLYETCKLLLQNIEENNPPMDDGNTPLQM